MISRWFFFFFFLLFFIFLDFSFSTRGVGTKGTPSFNKKQKGGLHTETKKEEGHPCFQVSGHRNTSPPLSFLAQEPWDTREDRWAGVDIKKITGSVSVRSGSSYPSDPAPLLPSGGVPFTWNGHASCDAYA